LGEERIPILIASSLLDGLVEKALPRKKRGDRVVRNYSRLPFRTNALARRRRETTAPPVEEWNAYHDHCEAE